MWMELVEETVVTVTICQILEFVNINILKNRAELETAETVTRGQGEIFPILQTPSTHPPTHIIVDHHDHHQANIIKNISTLLHCLRTHTQWS